jgi:hypothetical protein
MHTRLPLLQPNMDTELEPAKKLDFCAVATGVTTRLTWAAAVAIADAIPAS